MIWNVPTAAIRRQSLDLVKSIEFYVNFASSRQVACSAWFGRLCVAPGIPHKFTQYNSNSMKAAHFMFMEDDMQLCPNGMRALHHAVEKAEP